MKLLESRVENHMAEYMGDLSYIHKKPTGGTTTINTYLINKGQKVRQTIVKIPGLQTKESWEKLVGANIAFEGRWEACKKPNDA